MWKLIYYQAENLRFVVELTDCFQRTIIDEKDKFAIVLFPDILYVANLLLKQVFKTKPSNVFNGTCGQKNCSYRWNVNKYLYKYCTKVKKIFNEK